MTKAKDKTGNPAEAEVKAIDAEVVENVPATISQMAAVTAAASFDPSKVRIKKQVTVPLLKPAQEKPVFVTVVQAIYTSTREIDDPRFKKMENPDMLLVTDLSDGMRKEIICGAVLRRSLEEEYDDDGYVGLSFMLVKHRKQVKIAEDGAESAAQYHTWTVAEIEVDA